MTTTEQTDSTNLYVPMHTRSIVVNSKVKSNQPFYRWRMEYTNLNSDTLASPEPNAFNSNTGSPPIGVYLHWTLPKALRQGTQDSETGKTSFPLAPNRWLIVRYYGDPESRQCRAWVLESDCPTGDGSSSRYLVDQEIVDAWNANSGRSYDGIPATDLSANEPIVPNLGKFFDQENWQEEGIDKQFLTAVAPGNSLFTAYQPNVQNIFSFHDDLDAENPSNGEGCLDPTSLSYLIVGWYSNPDCDPLSTCQDTTGVETAESDCFENLLTQFNWRISDLSDDPSNDPESGIPTTSFYHSYVYGIDWDIEGEIPDTAPVNNLQAGVNVSGINDDATTTTGLHVAIGNNGVDAMTALFDQQLADSENYKLGEIAKPAKLLEAFYYEMLYKISEPSGALLLDQRIRQEWYDSHPGDLQWHIVDVENDELSQKSLEQQAITAEQESWIVELNSNQQQLNLALQDLRSKQNALYGIWYKQGLYSNFHPASMAPARGHISGQDFDNALDPQNNNSYTVAVKDAMETVAGFQPLVPTPVFGEDEASMSSAFNNGIDLFMQAKRDSGELAQDRVLKPMSGDRFWRAKEPSILISGAGTDQEVLDDTPLTVRLSNQLITGLNIDDSSGTSWSLSTNQLDQGQLPILNDGNLPSGLLDLLPESYFIDPINATSMQEDINTVSVEDIQTSIEGHCADNFVGILPDHDLETWQHSWSPTYMEWEVKYYHLPDINSGGNKNWTFDGVDYRYTAPEPLDTPDSYAISGRSYLSSHLPAVFKNSLENFIASNPEDTILTAVDESIESVDNWDFLSQSLTGFNQTIAQRQQKSNRSPDESLTFTFDDGTSNSLSELVGASRAVLPIMPSDERAFDPIRRGQIAVTKLQIYDNFGQVLNVVDNGGGVTDATHFSPITAEGLEVNKPVSTTDSDRFVQLPPRLMQPARLDFSLVDSQLPEQAVQSWNQANPVAGWLLPNHLDNAISLYDKHGLAAGELRLFCTTANNEQIVGWQASPQSNILSLEDLANHAPLLANQVNGLIKAGPTAMHGFMKSIDETLWNVDPLGKRSDQSLSVLIGRPLALVRSQLRFKLNAQPLFDTSWETTFDTQLPEFLAQKFDIRLGDKELHNDGLIGYYVDQDYDKFFAVTEPKIQTDELVPNSLSGYLQAISEGNFTQLSFSDNDFLDVMLLVDPRAQVHATTGLLPVKTVDIPSRFVDPVLSNMEVSIQLNSLLTSNTMVSDSNDPSVLNPAINLSPPFVSQGQWVWWQNQWDTENESMDWQSKQTQNTDERAHMNQTNSMVLDGFLQLHLEQEQS